MPDVKIRAVQVASPTTGAPVDMDFEVTGFGTPKAAMWVVQHGVTNGSLRAHARFGVGFSDGTRQRCFGIRRRDNRNDSSTRQNRSDADVIYLVSNTATTIDFEANWDSWLDNGVRISVTNTPGAAVLVYCVLFGGADLEAYVGDIVTSASISGTATSANIGFEMDQLIMGTSDRFATNFNTRNVIDAELLMGFADYDGSTITQGGWSVTCSDGQAQIHHGAVSSDTYAIRNITDNGAGTNTLGAGYELTSVGATDFTMTTRLTAEANDIAFLALRYGGLQHWMGRQNTANAAPPITQNIETPGFPLQCVLGLLGGQTGSTVDTSITGDSAGMTGMSVFNENEEFVAAVVADDNVTRSEEDSYADTYAIWNRNHGTAAECSANLDEFDSLGWNATFDQTRASTIQTWFMAIEKVPILVETNEVVNIGDDAVVLVSGPAGVVIVANETVNILDALKLQPQLIVLTSETVNILDGTQVQRAISLVLDEVVNITDDLDLRRGISLVTNETVNILEVLQLRRGISLVTSETVHILDGTQVLRVMSIVLDETVNIVEDPKLLRDMRLILGETVNIVEDLQVRRAISLVVDEIVHLVEQLQLRKATVVITNETVEISDAVQVQRDITLVLQETVQIQDQVVVLPGVIVIANETVNITDQLITKLAGTARIVVSFRGRILGASPEAGRVLSSSPEQGRLRP